MSSRWRWRSEPFSGELVQYRLRRGELTVAVVAPCRDGWFFHSADRRVNTLAEDPPRTWPEAEDARKAAREWAQAEGAKRAGPEA